MTTEQIEIVVTGANPTIAYFHARAIFEEAGGEIISEQPDENRSLEVAAYATVTIVAAFATGAANAAGQDAWNSAKRAFEKYREKVREGGGDAKWDGYL